MDNVTTIPTLDHAILFCLKNEDDSWRTNAKLEDLHDDAGWTFIGITQRYDGQYLKEKHNIDVVGLHKLYQTDKAAAVKIIVDCFRKKYWDNRGFDKVKSERIAIRLFDLSVNCGFGGLNNIMARAGLGKRFSPEAVNALIGNIGELPALSRIKAAALERYMSLENWPKFGKGWTNRLDKDEYTK